MKNTQWQPIDPGSLRHRLIFERDITAKNLSGGLNKAQEAWETVCSVRGSLEPLKGKESFDPAWTTTAIPYTAVIRRREDITEQMRIRFGVRVFQIRSAPQVAKCERYMEIICEEVKS